MAGATNSAKGSAYQGATEAVFAIVAATLLGYWADRHFGSEPVWLITGAIIGFAAFVLRLVRLGKLVEQMAAESSQVSEEDEKEPAAGGRETAGAGEPGGEQESSSGSRSLGEPREDR